MKTLIVPFSRLDEEQRWDIDYHLPSLLVREFPEECLVRVDEVAEIVRRDTRNPQDAPDVEFQYIDISSVDVVEGVIRDVKVMQGADAPSRARKVVRAFDILVSTVRPTRGAVAVVPVGLHNQIASTGYSVVRSFKGVNPYFLHFVLRLPSTREQFRKWSTGSSYPAILDEDVAKTLIPVPDVALQDEIADALFAASAKRQRIILDADSEYQNKVAELASRLAPDGLLFDEEMKVGGSATASFDHVFWDGVPSISSIDACREAIICSGF